MLKSLYSGVSGMKGFQTKLDVIGNNIANVNTVGFKKSRVMFQDIMNQNIAGATPPQDDRGGSNPMQIGLGSKVGAIETLHTPGSPMTTYIGTDLMIDGDAYFVVGPKKTGFDTDTNLLTKAGNFTRDSEGYLVTSNGYYLSGTTGGPGSLDQFSIKIVGDEVTGNKFTSYSIDVDGYINVVDSEGAIGKLARNAGGQYYLSTGANPENISITTGTVSNTAGLTKVGNTMYKESGNSGKVDFGRIAELEGGMIYAGSLEMSNVDLTEEFTEMIVAQRGFQANSRMITTSDSILEEVVNLKR
ncbi:flagellar hook-basal body complex protein [Bacillus marasmi]|uniref:flagellar hook-basal body complex protein n=1 Tax=Bacillus marasmi TaxID=1926279 RepID=UPI0011C9E2EC|nr:flagellar hook-basal body complex protein [Bacillus marasmi]